MGQHGMFFRVYNDNEINVVIVMIPTHWYFLLPILTAYNFVILAIMMASKLERFEGNTLYFPVMAERLRLPLYYRITVMGNH